MAYRISLFAVVALVITFGVDQAQGQEPRVDRAKIKAMADGEKRDWLRERMTATPPGLRRAGEIRERLDRLGRADLNRLVDAYFQQLALAQANLRSRAGVPGYGTPYGYPYGRRVGYAPVVTWLPTGTSLQTGGVISPDGRSVRISAQPFFSSVPYYDTFNFYNGQTRRYYVQGQPPRNTSATPYRYHDGLRTHYKRPQYERYNDGLRTRLRPIR